MTAMVILLVTSSIAYGMISSLARFFLGLQSPLLLEKTEGPSHVEYSFGVSFKVRKYVQHDRSDDIRHTAYSF